MSLGENVARLRRAKGLTQGDLSNKTGIKIGHISKIERDLSDPKTSTLYKLMQALECSPDSLMGDSRKVGVSGMMKSSFEMAQNLPDREKETVIDLIDKYCTAVGLQGILNKGTFFVSSKDIKGVLEEAESPSKG